MTKFGTKVLLFVRAQIIPSDFSTKPFFFLPVFRTWAATRRSAAPSTRWSPKGQRSRLKRRDWGRCRHVHRYEWETTENRTVKSLLHQSSAFILILLSFVLSKTQNVSKYLWKTTMVQNVEFFKGSLVQKETSDTQLKEMLRNVINSNEQFSFYYYFLVIWDIQSEEV